MSSELKEADELPVPAGGNADVGPEKYPSQQREREKENDWVERGRKAEREAEVVER